MLELLNSNYPPVLTKNQEFSDVFYRNIAKSEKVTIASGYISEDSIAEIAGLYKEGVDTKLDLIVGMHYFEGFSPSQYASLQVLAEILKEKKLGKVYLASSVKYHGKIYLFENTSGQQISIVGSSNLTKINTSEQIYDTDVLIDDTVFSKKISDFLSLLIQRNCEDIFSIDSTRLKIESPKNLFDGYLSVQTIDNNYLSYIQSKKTSVSFEVLLKTKEKSNLNCYFGKGRENISTGLIIPRPWYEVEIIVSKEIRQNPDYPRTEFKVVTDDGYSFKCKTTGQDFKNIRSADDLKILGRWIKGRMENKQALAVGEMVTDATFEKYGRNTITLTKTSDDNIWFLDFGVYANEFSV